MKNSLNCPWILLFEMRGHPVWLSKIRRRQGEKETCVPECEVFVLHDWIALLDSTGRKYLKALISSRLRLHLVRRRKSVSVLQFVPFTASKRKLQEHSLFIFSLSKFDNSPCFKFFKSSLGDEDFIFYLLSPLPSPLSLPSTAHQSLARTPASGPPWKEITRRQSAPGLRPHPSDPLTASSVRWTSDLSTCTVM